MAQLCTVAYSMFASSEMIITYTGDAASLCYTDVVAEKETDSKNENKTESITSFLTEGLRLSLFCYYLAITWIVAGFQKILAAGVSC